MSDEFYWVKEYNERWVVVEKIEENRWYYPGVDYLLTDKDFAEIGDKIECPHQ